MVTLLLTLLLAAPPDTAPLEKRTYDLAADGSRVMAGTEAGVVVWEWKGGALERIGLAPLPDSVNTLAPIGGAVLASVGPEGVFRVDLATREARLLADTRGAAMDALMDGETLIVAEGTLGVGFYRGGAETARVPAADYCRSLARHGGALLAACGTDGVLRLDAQGKVLGRIATPGGARRLAVEGSRLAVAMGKAGIALYDLQDASRPALWARLESPDGAHDAQWDGNLLFTADGKAGFRVFEVGRDGKPALRGAFPTIYMANRVRPLGGKLYLAEDGQGFRVMEWRKGAAVQLHPKGDGKR